MKHNDRAFLEEAAPEPAASLDLAPSDRPPDLDAARATAKNTVVVTEPDGARWVATVGDRVSFAVTRPLGPRDGDPPEAARQALVARFA